MAEELVTRHHEAQKLIARNAIAELNPLWQILDFHDLNGTTADWLRAVRPVVEKGYLVSQYVASQFLRDHRAAIYPHETPLNIEVPNPLGLFGTAVPADRETQLKIMVSMKVTGPDWVMKNTGKNPDVPNLMRRGFSKSSGAATRLILNGGRGMVRLHADVDQLAVGVAGVADEDSCDSCKFLQTPILKSAGARKMDAVAVGHDFCKCSARLVYEQGIPPA